MNNNSLEDYQTIFKKEEAIIYYKNDFKLYLNEICDLITSNKVVRRLHILNCKLDDEDLIAICKALKLNSLVNGIEFTGNIIKTEGMKQVETLIRLKPTLKFLILKENKICSNDVIYLCNGIRSNNSITRLYL